ncbi:MAG TPA: sigma 54-interacting transcriptional regulator, partial [Polyangiales bacterium]
MMLNNKVALYCDGQLVTERVLGEGALEIGSSSGADFVLDEPDVPPRAYLVQARGGTVWLYDLTRPKLEPRVLALDTPLALGLRHQLVRSAYRREAARRAPDAQPTLPLDHEPAAASRWTVLVGRGADARRITVGDKPVRVGKSAHNELVLHDPTVSGEHCRFEPQGNVLCVRDLDSTNGTYVHGLRVTRAQLSAGARVRVGRTDLRVVVANSGGGPDSRQPQAPLVATSISMQDTMTEARKFAALSWPLLVLGPSGAGKEELARLVHRESAKREGPFVALNAGGLPRELIESELFGHEKGSFTGAVGQRRGAFEQAHGGTLFLDEIGELPLELQARLLRVLETWQIRRVGGESAISVDVRLVCATHRDLARMVQEGTFRQDLFYRLAFLVLRVAPLCERQEDILPLADHFLRALSPEIGARTLCKAAEARLLAHAWPGNARELRNVLSVAAALSPAPVLEASDIDQAIARIAGPSQVQLDPETIQHAVERCGGNLSAAARLLAVPRSTLRDRLKRKSEPPGEEGG